MMPGMYPEQDVTMLSIQTNIASLTAQQNLNTNNTFMNQTITQLTSGYRINSSSDDAAGLVVILMYGAHLIKNGAMAIVNRLIERGWVTHLATNGAGTIHDWELAFLGRTEESVKKNVATGTFGTWDETGRYIHLSLLAGALQHEGYGRSLGRFIYEDGVTLPTTASLVTSLRDQPADPLASARADLLQAMLTHRLPPGRLTVQHPWKSTSILAQAFTQ